MQSLVNSISAPRRFVNDVAAEGATVDSVCATVMTRDLKNEASLDGAATTEAKADVRALLQPIARPRLKKGRWTAYGQPIGPQKEVFVGVANSGAKFTRRNHPLTGDSVLDEILQGQRIPLQMGEILTETRQVYNLGARYLHWHARNPLTSEQSSDPEFYKLFGELHRQYFPDLALSYGASRNGIEIQDRIGRLGEWSRLSHTMLPRHAGGADFVTTQAAAELTVVIDLEAQGYLRQVPGLPGYEIGKPLDQYIANRQQAAVAIEAHSTAGGANYGTSCPRDQLAAVARATMERSRLNLPQEVEWTQLDRSYQLTRLLLQSFKPGLGDTGRLNLTILFGFSPKLPFPRTYEEFQKTVNLARSLAPASGFPALHLTITVGAAVLPQRARALVDSLDIGPYRGVRVPPLERLVAYACQPDSNVDMIRFGLEDHPFLLDDDAQVRAVTNVELTAEGIDLVAKHGGTVVTDPIRVRQFISTEPRPYLVEDIFAPI